MILTCPECATRYLIDPAVLLPEGRRVRCAKCGTDWREHPPGDMPKRIEVEPPPQRVRPLPRGSNLPALARAPERSSGLVGWLVLLAVVVAIAAGGWFGRNAIVRLWPPAAQLYMLIGAPVSSSNDLGLDLSPPRSTPTTESGATVLVVSGEIMNHTREVRRVPKLRGSLKNAAGQEIFNWFFVADDSQIAPGGRLTYTTRVPSSPAEARSLEVTFAGSDSGDKP